MEILDCIGIVITDAGPSWPSQVSERCVSASPSTNTLLEFMMLDGQMCNTPDTKVGSVRPNKEQIPETQSKDVHEALATQLGPANSDPAIRDAQTGTEVDFICQVI